MDDIATVGGGVQFILLLLMLIIFLYSDMVMLKPEKQMRDIGDAYFMCIGASLFYSLTSCAAAISSRDDDA